MVDEPLALRPGVRPLYTREYERLVDLGVFVDEPIELVRGTLVEHRHPDPPRVRPLRRDEYDRMVDLGMLEGENVELLRGEMIVVSPQGSLHSWVIEQLTRLITPLVEGRATVKVQSPLSLSAVDEPEPDFALVPLGDYRFAHPTTALLVVEVAVSSLGYDVKTKALIYATAGIPEFWIVDVKNSCVQVHLDPTAGRYTRIVRVERGGVLAPVLLPGVSVTTAEILP